MLVRKLLLPVGWVAVGTYLIIAGRSIDPVGVDDPFGPGGFPTVVGSVLIILGAWLAIQQARAPVTTGATTEVTSATSGTATDDTAGGGTMGAAGVAEDTAEAAPEVGRDDISAWRPAVVIAIVAGYVIVVPVLGFIAATAVATAAIATVTARRFSLALGVIYPIAVAGVLYLVFSVVLGIRLP